MWKLISLTLFTSFLLVACAIEETTEKDQSDDLYEPLEYEEDEGLPRRGHIPLGKDSYFKRTAEDEFRKSRYTETNRSHNNDFNNEESMTIMEKVNEINEITLSQAFTTDDHVYVAVMINPYYLKDRGKISEEVLRKVKNVTDKEVTVFTSNSDWEDIKDFNARHKAAEAPDKVMKKIKNFFNQNNRVQ